MDDHNFNIGEVVHVIGSQCNAIVALQAATTDGEIVKLSYHCRKLTPTGDVFPELVVFLETELEAVE